MTSLKGLNTCKPSLQYIKQWGCMDRFPMVNHSVNHQLLVMFRLNIKIKEFQDTKQVTLKITIQCKHKVPSLIKATYNLAILFLPQANTLLKQCSRLVNIHLNSCSQDMPKINKFQVKINLSLNLHQLSLLTILLLNSKSQTVNTSNDLNLV